MSTFSVTAMAQETAPVRLDTVVVTVDRGPGRSVLTSPFALSVVRPDSSRPGQRHTSIDESLTLVPGLLAVNRNNPAQDPRISIRGFGARSAFGVRGVRVLRDGMPLTLPDGQTPLDYLSLESVGHIEVMRGAASALYGNASGGVVDIRSLVPAASLLAVVANQWAGGNGFAKSSLAISGSSVPAWYLGDAAFTKSDGARRHSRQRSTIWFARSGLTAGGTDYAISMLALDNPLAENPGALTRGEMELDPLIADPVSVRRGARKAVRQIQIGATAATTMAWGEFSLAAFGAARSLDNPLTFGIVEIGRHSYGASGRLSGTIPIAGKANRFSAGVDLQSQNDLRRNYATCIDTVPLLSPTASCPFLNADRGVVTLDQRELAGSAGAYARDEVVLTSALTLTAGARVDRVRFEVKDRLVGSANPDDSGRRSLAAFTPVVGLLARLAPTHSVYANMSGAFETPTATELGNHADGSAGINPDLDPQRSRSIEAGVKGFVGAAARYDVAIYSTAVRDELVPFEIPASNGRRYFRNAGRTRRRGAEAGAELSSGPLTLTLAYTYSAFHFVEYRQGPTNFAGNEIPGVPRNRLQGALKLSGGGAFAVIEGEATSAAFVDDANSAMAPGYGATHIRLGTMPLRHYAALAVTTGIQNIFDRHYASSLAVNAARGRNYEPAAGRNAYVGISIRAQR